MYYRVKRFLEEAASEYLSSLNLENIAIQRDDFFKQSKLDKGVEFGECKQNSKQKANASSSRCSDDCEVTWISISLELPKDRKHGHFATPLCFSLTKILRKSPGMIAQDLQAFIVHYDLDFHKDKPFKKMFSSIHQVNGYINLSLSGNFIIHMLELALAKPQDFAKADNRNVNILLEYVSANPTGPLHIGHARGAIFGNVLQRIGKRLGYNIESEYYVNDAGSQIDMLALSVYNAAAKILGFSLFEGEVYRGDYIDCVAESAIGHFGEDFFCKMQSIQSGQNIQTHKNFQSLGIYAKDLMLQKIKQNLCDLSIDFDHFVSEKELYRHFDDTLQTLEKHNALLHKDGAIWLRSSLKGDEKDRVLVRDNSMPTYMAGDIIYHKNKFDRDYNHYINIWGADHHGYISRIKASIDFLGFDSNKLEVLLAQMVSLLKNGQPYKMSKRAGNFILIQDVVNDIGADSLKFVFLSKSLDTHLEFDVQDLSKEDSSNPVFYINYANARIHTLLEKSDFTNRQIQDIDLTGWLDKVDCTLQQDSTYLILQSLGLFHVLNQSYEERALQKLCEYLKNLAKSFHAFYNAHRILQTENEAQILKIFLLVSLSLTTGFCMLGIDIKTRM